MDLDALIEARSLTPAQERIAALIASSPEAVALASLSELAGRLGVNESTVVRFCTAIGLSGYAELRRLCAGRTRSHGTMLERFESADPDAGAARDRSARAAASAIATTFSRLEVGSWDRAVGLLSDAEGVVVVGARQSAPMAESLAYLLGLVRPRCTAVTGQGPAGLEPLRDLGERDVVVCIGIAPCSRVTVRAAQWCAGRGVPVVAVADAAATDLARNGDVVLTPETRGPGVLSSMSAVLAIIEALADDVARAGATATSARLSTEEELITFFEAYDA